MASWRTYAPDGRVLEVEHSDGEWSAACEGARATGSSAHEAIAGALGTEEAGIGVADSSIEAWVAAHAAQLEAEASA